MREQSLSMRLQLVVNLRCDVFGEIEPDHQSFRSAEEHRLAVCARSRFGTCWRSPNGKDLRWADRPKAYVPLSAIRS